MSTFKYKLTLAYDGTHYLGWQKTKMGPSIQESLQIAIGQITKEIPLPEAASRTDKGVHAQGQIVSIVLSQKWDPIKLQKALNTALPKDIRVMALEKALFDFHPTLHALEKEYHYQICIGEVPDLTQRLYAWAFRKSLCLNQMQDAASALLGTKDFSAFSNAAPENPICTIQRITVSSLSPERLQIAVMGNRFLYKMVRNIVGTLLYIGCGKLESDSIPHILTSKDRKKAGMTAPAHGLVLYRVRYTE